MKANFVSVFVGVITAVGVLLPSTGAQADILWNNGPTTTNPSAGLGGANVSRASSNFNVAGANCFRNPDDGQTNNTLADNFTVGSGGWTVNTVTGFVTMSSTYPNPPVTSPIQSMTCSIYNAVPGDNSPVATTTTILNNSWNNAYRVLNTAALTTSSRPIWAVTVDFGNLALPAGEYWATFNYLGLSPTATRVITSPFVMGLDGSSQPVTVNGNARILAISPGGVGGWADFRGGTPQQGVELPFLVNGTAVPAPGAAMLLGAGGLFASRRRRAV